MKEYGFVFIDADDTIFDYQAAEKYALTEAFARYGVSLTNQNLADYSRLNKQLWIDYENNKISQEELRVERFRRLFKAMDRRMDEKAFSETYLGFLAESSHLVSDAEEICGYLHGKYTLAVITNGISAVQRNRLKNSRIRQFVDYLIISEDARFSKPNIGIFQYAESVTNYRDKAKMIIIGDSLSSDVQGGINYGIDTCWLNGGDASDTKGITPTYVITALNDLKRIL